MCSLLSLLGRGGGRKVRTPRQVDVLPVALREFGIKSDVFWLVPEVVEELIEVLEMEEACGLHQLAVLSI